MESGAMARSLCSAATPTPAPLLPIRLAARIRRPHALSSPARPLVARCAAAGDKVEAGTPIEKILCVKCFFSVDARARYPFLLVDRVIDYKPGEYAVAIKNVSINDDFFQGHFPDRPIMPGVLMVEALAQVGGIVMLQPEVGGSRENFFFAGIDKVRFRKPVVPGDTLIMRMTLIKLQKRFGIAKMEGKAYVGADLVCEGEFLMATGSE
ncbi:hypothetical protein PR202_gb01348 [Eleusine coracana subsp. coracana]|uniref:3-hydroxyacyl-[acyl-carrier-protein] dehydratase n=1 Tax=Eleusine coracana subsp. coracana TaxID=191504 RepID=A0AAV5DW89_ELECO|nr:hypothetical protein PR202_gb01348 [Eleusine coracana subsp. coracana]